MKETIRKKAFELGFDLCGFARAEPPATANFFKKWLEKGYHAGMNWMEKGEEKRLNPQLILPSAKTVIAVGASYFCDILENRGERGGLVARYAQYVDYHNVMQTKLAALTAYILSILPDNARAVYYVDTGAILERDFAQRAGLGFIGKHTNLISRSYGNWVLLGEILTTVEIPPDTPEKNRCGKCSLCITACPTKAIVAPFELNSWRCISYLTIEHRGSIPVEMRELIGDRLFGCDDCLAVCPWNRFAKAGNLMKKELLRLPSRLELKALFDLDEAGFKRIFGETPLRRLGLQRLLRNSCVALGNIGDEKDLPVLEKAANATDPVVAEHSRWAIDRIKTRIKSPT